MSAGPVLLLDAATLYYRAFHALPSSMTAPDGAPHGAVRGFLSTLGALVDRHAASGVVACWDADWRPAWRVALVPSYKAHRVADHEREADEESGSHAVEDEPDDLAPQIGAIAALLDAMGVPRIGVAEYEADDVVATLATRLDGPIVAVSGDRDLLQIASPKASVLLAVNGGMDRWPLLDPEGVRERTGVEPAQYVDMAVLRGDPSDGLPGAAGIGAKTAPALIARFGSLEGLLAAARTGIAERPLTPRIAATLLDQAEHLRAARTVATAVTTLDLDDDRRRYALPRRPADPEALEALAADWGVARFIPTW